MSSNQQPIFYGLLYVDKQKRQHINIRGGGAPIDIYLRCAVLCARSVTHHGYRFRLLTNEKSKVERRIQELGLEQLELIELELSLDVPNNLRFWAAHFKLDVYRMFG